MKKMKKEKKNKKKEKRMKRKKRGSIIKITMNEEEKAFEKQNNHNTVSCM